MITASIVTYKTSYKDLETVLSCTSQSDVAHIYLIDNSPTDDLRVFGDKFPKVEYIWGHGNVGYGAGHNIAIYRAVQYGSEYHIVVNPDVEFNLGVIEELKNFMEINSSIGLVMPNVLYPSGDIQKLCKLLPTPSDLFFRRFLPFKSLVEKMNARYELHFTNYENQMDAPSLSGCFMFLRMSALKQINGFDERFFMYLEDVDLCRRIGAVSRTVFYPEVSVTHNYEKGSYKNMELLRYHIKSTFQYFNKWGWVFDKQRKLINKKALEELGYYQ